MRTAAASAVAGCAIPVMWAAASGVTMTAAMTVTSAVTISATTSAIWGVAATGGATTLVSWRVHVVIGPSLCIFQFIPVFFSVVEVRTLAASHL